MNYSYSILVNTCDKFEDCWNPFFMLWSLYWKDCKGKIYLNTEYKDYSYPGIDITSVKGCVGKQFKGKYATWSQCLRWALEKIESDVILYLQEDYFLKDNVKNTIVEEFVNLMTCHPEIKCIHLTDQAVKAEGVSEFEHLNIVIPNQRYRVSCQAALWRKDELMAIIRDYESAWEFEEFGSQRSAVINHNYYVVDNNWVKLNAFEIIPYVFTGIVQGRWYELVVPLFEKHGIVVDFSKRGFLKDAPKKPLIKKIKYHLHKIPCRIKNQLELNKLRKSM